jgi:hypothetical protein
VFKSRERRIDPPQLAKDLRLIAWGAGLVTAAIPLSLVIVGLALGAVGAVLLAVGYYKCWRASTWGILSHLLLTNVLPIGFVRYAFNDEWLPLALSWIQLSALASSFPFLKFMRRVSSKLGISLPSSKVYAVAGAIVLAVSAGVYIYHFSGGAAPPGGYSGRAGIMSAGIVLLLCLPMLVWFTFP